MDWGLFDKNAGENRYLREEIVYSQKVSNCFALVMLTANIISFLLGFLAFFIQCFDADGWVTGMACSL